MAAQGSDARVVTSRVRCHISLAMRKGIFIENGLGIKEGPDGGTTIKVPCR